MCFAPHRRFCAHWNSDCATLSYEAISAKLAITGSTMDGEQRRHLVDLRQIHLRRLHELEYKAAAFGLNAPPEVILEIQDIRHTITQLDRQLDPTTPRMPRGPVPDLTICLCDNPSNATRTRRTRST